MLLNKPVALGAALLMMSACKSDPSGSKAASADTSGSAAAVATSDDAAANVVNWEHVSSSQLPQVKNYTPLKCAREDIARCLAPATGANGMTHDLDGIWWMDGNPLPDTCVSVGHAVYDPIKRAAVSGVFDNDNFSFHGDDNGLALWQGTMALHLTYETDYSADLKHAQTYPIIYVHGVMVRIPEWIAKFTMDWTQDGLWTRHSWFFNQQVQDYRFTRIINADGTPDHNANLPDPYKDPYARYIQNTQAYQYVIKPNN